MLDAKIPEGSLEQKWRNYQIKSHLINPSNKKKLKVIIVGTGLAGAGAAATLAEMGYHVKCFCYQDFVIKLKALRLVFSNNFVLFKAKMISSGGFKL